MQILGTTTEYATRRVSLGLLLSVVVLTATSTGVSAAGDVAPSRARRSTTSPAPTKASSIPFAHWHCGSDAFSKQVSHDEIADNCPDHAHALNHCCAVHDDCYGQQLGQAECDAIFCRCNMKALRLPTNQSVACRPVLQMACALLDFFGASAYGASNYSDPVVVANHVEVIKVTPKTTPEIEAKYYDLYSTCAFVNITLSSCAYNFNECRRKSIDSETCTNQLCNCVLDAGEADPSRPQCRVDVEQTCRLALLYANSEFESQFGWYMIMMVVVSLLVVVALVGTYVYYVKLPLGRLLSKPFDDGKCHMTNVDSTRSIKPLLFTEQ